ncbi:MAG: Rrf2 family transcriptional regulator [Candidatus Omnitrophica bacterium]|nr:Rrf2 family transcriptional regulator [Candidatus Omnitrophota bacterium]
MINFTTNLRYSLRLLINLALGEKIPRKLKTIAGEENISLSYLRKLIIPLDKAGIVKSSRGPGGGFTLNREASDLPLSELIDILERTSKVLGCVKGLSDCRRYEDCIVKDLLEEVYDKVQAVFEKRTLATLINRKNK